MSEGWDGLPEAHTDEALTMATEALTTGTEVLTETERKARLTVEALERRRKKLWDELAAIGDAITALQPILKRRL